MAVYDNMVENYAELFTKMAKHFSKHAGIVDGTSRGTLDRFSTIVPPHVRTDIFKYFPDGTASAIFDNNPTSVYYTTMDDCCASMIILMEYSGSEDVSGFYRVHHKVDPRGTSKAGTELVLLIAVDSKDLYSDDLQTPELIAFICRYHDTLNRIMTTSCEGVYDFRSLQYLLLYGVLGVVKAVFNPNNQFFITLTNGDEKIRCLPVFDEKNVAVLDNIHPFIMNAFTEVNEGSILLAIKEGLNGTVRTSNIPTARFVSGMPKASD